MQDNDPNHSKVYKTNFNTSIIPKNSLKHHNSPRKSISDLSSDISLEYLKKTIRVKYGGITNCANVIDMNRSELAQILGGHYIPQSIRIIQKLSDALNIHVIILTHFFSNASKSKLNPGDIGK